jgi:hypothetical protein
MFPYGGMMFDKDGKIKKELVSQALEHLKNRKEILPPMLIESNAPDGSKCPSCHKETLKIKRMPLSGAYSGGIYCFSCDFRDSVIGYLGKQMVQVQPMPQGAEQIYLKDPEDKE